VSPCAPPTQPSRGAPIAGPWCGPFGTSWIEEMAVSLRP
jgi:hypothetical protein